MQHKKGIKMKITSKEQRVKLVARVDAFKAAGETLENAAKKAGVNIHSYYNWKKGLAPAPTSTTIDVQTAVNPITARKTYTKRTKTTNSDQVILVMGSPEVIAEFYKGLI